MLDYQGWGQNSSHCNVLNALKNLIIVLEVLVHVLISCYLLNQLGCDVVVDVSHGLRGSCTDKEACEGPEEPGEHGDLNLLTSSDLCQGSDPCLHHAAPTPRGCQ